MDDDNVIRLHPKDAECLLTALENPARPNAALRDLLHTDNPNCWPASETVACEDMPSPEFAKLDIDALFNMREWVRVALEAKGAKVVGCGMGCGGTMGIADIQIELDGGHQLNIEIRPL